MWVWWFVGVLSNVFTIINTANFTMEEASIVENVYDYEYVIDEEIGPEVLNDPGPFEYVLSGQQIKPVSPPKRGFIAKEEDELLRLHNFYRSKVSPPAGNMLFMEWDTDLTRFAQLWADKCKFKHGFPAGSPPEPMGQNLYIGPEENGTRAMLLWYEEYVDYDLKTGDCTPGKQCGHYTQLAWAKSKRVGCGVKKCGPHRYLIVCHYSPAGNVHNVAPYAVGKPCSLCNSVDGGHCTTNLCVTQKQCERNAAFCENAECALKCQNCGVLEKESCRCKCTPGWDGPDCSMQCRDEHEKCGENPGWPTKTYCSMNGFAVQDKYCRKMCSQCYGVDDEGNEPQGSSQYQQSHEPGILLRNGTCCAGTLCPPGHVLDLERRLCRCHLLCPGPLCYDAIDAIDALETAGCDELQTIKEPTFFLLLYFFILNYINI